MAGGLEITPTGPPLAAERADCVISARSPQKRLVRVGLGANLCSPLLGGGGSATSGKRRISVGRGHAGRGCRYMVAGEPRGGADAWALPGVPGEWVPARLRASAVSRITCS